MDLILEQLATNKIHTSKRALKLHSEHQIGQIARSIQEFGFNDPIALDEQNAIIEGEGRLAAAKQLKLTTVPVIRLNHLTDAQKRAYRIAHNKLCLNSGFDLERLQEEFQELLKLDDSILFLTGFEEAELTDLFKLHEVPDLAPELTESLEKPREISCPHCGGTIYD